jgi:multiple sugar transport system permease protein
LVGFFSFVANWTNYYLPYVLLPETNQLPVQVGLAILGVSKPELALATLLAITPVLAVFLFSQRFLVSGILAGATRS